ACNEWSGRERDCSARTDFPFGVTEGLVFIDLPEKICSSLAQVRGLSGKNSKNSAFLALAYSNIS
ncbi:MAG TPA: hypothetical protein VE870_15135, partial [Bacteroidales bacterium]|nr:hypothetical protein [Bacteroidales bacterium]